MNFNDQPAELDPVIEGDFKVDMRRRDPFGHIYLVYEGKELEDLGVFTTVDSAYTHAKLYIESIKDTPRKKKKVA